MADVTLSKAVRSNLLSLQSTAAAMGKTQERLATGLKVNSALDNPTNFFTASSLNSRASDLNQLLDSVSNAVQTIAAADKGLTAITKLVESAQATARQALQTSATVETSTTTGAAPEELARVVGGTYAAPSGSNATLTINGSDVTITDGANIATAVQAINDANITGVTASVGTGTDSGKIVLTGSANTDIAVTTATAGFAGTESDTYTAANPGTTTTSTSANPKREELRTQYNDLLSQIDQLAKDSGFNGVNLLDGDSLEVLFNEDGSSKLAVTGVTFNAAGLGLDALASGDFDNNSDINATLNDLKAGIDSLRTQAAKFGSNLSVVETRQDFTKNMINVLETGAANLTLADSNEEAANLLALQTRQQLSSTALSLASQADQNVLRLF
ncbi:Flagellin FlgL [Devosia enhydra]|uniref:Flagellin n=1 Tax=Devosia enhydra TaxID=665118 RepID=A0A1K2HUZ9_9HYPH|nr:flagellin [Devosia enhydra]SFZ81486.1 Flagellin FlgL [Devosia enhydra]